MNSPSERLPRGPFPEKSGHVNTHCVDAVEKRVFEVMGKGDHLIKRLGRGIPVDPRFSLAAGLVALVAMLWLLLAGGGR